MRNDPFVDIGVGVAVTLALFLCCFLYIGIAGVLVGVVMSIIEYIGVAEENKDTELSFNRIEICVNGVAKNQEEEIVEGKIKKTFYIGKKIGMVVGIIPAAGVHVLVLAVKKLISKLNNKKAQAAA